MKIIRATTIPKSLDVFCRGILKKLSEKYEVVALSSPGEEMQAIAEREGVRTITVPMERHISPWKDIVGLLCMIAAWLTHVPVRVHTFTGLVFPTAKGLQRRLLMLTDSITCRCATYIIPEGEGVKKDLLDYGITDKPLRVLGFGNVMGVDMYVFSRRPEVMEKARLLRDEHCFTFLFVGRIVRDTVGVKTVSTLCQKKHLAS